MVHSPPPRDPPAVTVLCYHTFDASKGSPFTVDSQRFREQMRFIQVQRLPVIPLARLAAHVQSGAPLPDHSVVITIDDGYKTARTKAWPILKQFNFPFTLFLHTQQIGQASALSWEDVRFLAANGVDIQSHSVSHPLLTHPPKSVAPEEYGAWLDHELVESKRLLEKHVGKPVIAFAYPYGGYDEQVVERTRQAGYRLAFTCDDGNVTHFSDPWHINRRLVFRDLSRREFAGYFLDRPLRLAECSPRDGERVTRPIHEIQTRVLNVDQILPESASILIDKLGKQPLPVAIDPRDGRLRFSLPSLPKTGQYLVSVYAQDKARPCLCREASWAFILSKNVSRK